MYAFAYDIRTTCSSGKPAAEHIKEQGLERLPKVGIKVTEKEFVPPRYRWEIDEIQSTLVYLDDKRIYDPKGNQFEVYWRYYAYPDYHKLHFGGHIVEEMRRVSEKLDSDILMIVVRPQNSDETILPPEFKKLKDFPRGLWYGESISLYIFPKS